MAGRRIDLDAGTLVLDCDGLSKLHDDDAATVSYINLAARGGVDVVVSPMTIIEATHKKTKKARMAWLLGGIRIDSVDKVTAKAASDLLIAAGLHGHKYAIDAVVAEMALRQPPPVAMLTSDVDDMRKLCGDGVALIAT